MVPALFWTCCPESLLNSIQSCSPLLFSQHSFPQHQTHISISIWTSKLISARLNSLTFSQTTSSHVFPLSLNKIIYPVSQVKTLRVFMYPSLSVVASIPSRALILQSMLTGLI
jgi:hypothetical protein